MKKTQNKGFTLVELIIVITILAILATIAFVSFSGYAGQSRDAKKQSELSNLKNKVEVAIAANSQDVLSFVTDNSALKISGGVQFAGATVNTSTGYSAGEINYAVLGAESNKYKFKYGIGVVKNTGGSFYQLSSLLEDGSLHTIGNYSPRKNDPVTYKTVTGSDKKFVFEGANIGKFRVGDTLEGNGKVTKVSNDLSTVDTTGSVTETSSSIKLAASEATDLVNKDGLK